MKETLAPMISDESFAIVALLHDLGKMELAGRPMDIDGDRYPYSYNKELVYLSVPIRSI